ncbi:MAG: class I SAM-dependent DNA methyltransferase [Bacillota bacterium]
MEKAIWDFWSKRYHRLWVQKKSLKPTREYVVDMIQREWNRGARDFLDLGCGPGELIHMANERIGSIDITGIDFSKGMLVVSRERNPGARHLLLEAEKLEELKESFQIISCTHSFPYYRNKKKVLEDIKEILKPDGKLIIAFASGNSLYDRMALSFVKLTTGSAYYPSDKEFREMARENFHVESMHIIRESFYMPTIAIYILRRLP